MTKGDKELAWVFGGAAALYAVYFFWPKGQSVANPPTPAPAPQNDSAVQSAIANDTGEAT